MKTKPLIISMAAILSLGAVSSQAAYRPDFSDKARAISSTPVVDHVNEFRNGCWTETAGYEQQVCHSRSDNGGAILGAIAGGLLGSTVGDGAGKIPAATGAVIGDRMDGDRHYYSTSRPRNAKRR